ncbi:MAG: STAS domain-containing protein [Duodenibacillus sp.]|nr:STAS domain-containing protein [Duodenibacillus sp.]
MNVVTSEKNGVVVLSVEGSMDATTVTQFDAEWKKVLEGGAKKLVIEMSGLEYISSAGLRGILMLAKMGSIKGASLAFAGMRAMVADMFKLSGFDSILKTYPDVDAAVDAM